MKVCQVLSGLSLSLLTLHLQAAPQTNFGDRGTNNNNNNNNNNQQQLQQQGGSEEDVDNKIFFGNSNLNNVLLGAALGGGAALITQEIINGQNNQQCNCGPARKKRQSQAQAGDQKIFGLLAGGGGGCDCGSPPASVEFGADCKGRPEGNPYYGCGCSDNAAGGLFTFGRRKRQINITPSSSSSSGEDVNKKFLNFRCLDAALTGRNQNKPTGQ